VISICYISEAVSKAGAAEEIVASRQEELYADV